MLKPRSDQLLIKPDEESRERNLGNGVTLLIPETADKKIAETGIIVAVGPGRSVSRRAVFQTTRDELEPMDVGIGDRVLFHKYAGTEVEVDGVKAMLVKHEDIIGIIEAA